MLLDPVGGNAVNLTCGHDKPEDIYQQVADGVLKLVNEDAQHGTSDEHKMIKNTKKRLMMTQLRLKGILWDTNSSTSMACLWNHQKGMQTPSYDISVRKWTIRFWRANL